MKMLLGLFLFTTGMITIAGAGGDCDGRCMELANTMEQFVLYSVFGLSLAVTGAIIMWQERDKI